MPDRITTVFLDLDGTLLDEADLSDAIASTCEVVENAYPELKASAFRQANAIVWTRYWAEIGEAYLQGGVTGIETNIEVWRRTLYSLGSTQKSALDFAVETYRTAERNAWRLFPEVTSVLHDLASAGTHLGLITNGASDTQREKLEVLGLTDAFDHIFISGEVGAAKPSRVLFEYALSHSKTQSTTAIHVGDSLESDIAGAQSVGMAAAWVNRGNAVPIGSARATRLQIGSLTEIPALLL